MAADRSAATRLCVECLQVAADCECPQGFTDPEALAEHLSAFVSTESREKEIYEEIRRRKQREASVERMRRAYDA